MDVLFTLTSSIADRFFTARVIAYIADTSDANPTYHFRDLASEKRIAGFLAKNTIDYILIVTRIVTVF